MTAATIGKILIEAHDSKIAPNVVYDDVYSKMLAAGYDEQTADCIASAAEDIAGLITPPDADWYDAAK